MCERTAFKFNQQEMSAMVALVSQLEDDPASDDIIDQLIRRCRDIAQRAASFRTVHSQAGNCGGSPCRPAASIDDARPNNRKGE